MKTVRLRTKNRNIKKIEKALGATLIASRADGTVNGYVNFVTDGDGFIAEVVLYEEDKDPDFQLYEKDGVTYSKGKKITIRKAV